MAFASSLSAASKCSMAAAFEEAPFLGKKAAHDDGRKPKCVAPAPTYTALPDLISSTARAHRLGTDQERGSPTLQPIASSLLLVLTLTSAKAPNW